MKHPSFSDLLNQLVKDSGLSRQNIIDAVEDLYADDVRLTRSDLSNYLSKGVVPRGDKFSALVDVLGATQGEISRLVRAMANRKRGLLAQINVTPADKNGDAAQN